MTATTCKVCRAGALRLQQADAMLRDGKPYAVVARFLGVTRHSVSRHQSSGHVAPAPMVAPTTSPPVAPPVAPSNDPIDVMQKAMDDLAAVDTTNMSPAARSAHFDNLRRAAESLARIKPPDHSATVIRVADVEGLEAFIADVFTLGDKYPMIRPELAAIRKRHFPEEGA